MNDGGYRSPETYIKHSLHKTHWASNALKSCHSSKEKNYLDSRHNLIYITIDHLLSPPALRRRQQQDNNKQSVLVARSNRISFFLLFGFLHGALFAKNLRKTPANFCGTVGWSHWLKFPIFHSYSSFSWEIKEKDWPLLNFIIVVLIPTVFLLAPTKTYQIFFFQRHPFFPLYITICLFATTYI